MSGLNQWPPVKITKSGILSVTDCMHHCLSVLSIIVSTDPSGAVGEQCEGLLMPIYDPRADGPICTYGSPFAQICQFRFLRHSFESVMLLVLIVLWIGTSQNWFVGRYRVTLSKANAKTITLAHIHSSWQEHCCVVVKIVLDSQSGTRVKSITTVI